MAAIFIILIHAHHILVGGHEVAEKDLRQVLAGRDATIPIAIIADADVPYSVLVTATQGLREAHITGWSCTIAAKPCGAVGIAATEPAFHVSDLYFAAPSKKAISTAQLIKRGVPKGVSDVELDVFCGMKLGEVATLLTAAKGHALQLICNQGPY